jgi:hypothetical protein
MKEIILILIFSWTNISIGQSLNINNGTDTIYLGADNEIQIETELPNVILQTEIGDLRKVQEHYYKFKICDSITTDIKIYLRNAVNNNLINEFQLKVFKAKEPIIVPYFRKYPMGVRAIPKINADLPFTVTEYKLEIIRKNGEKEIYLNLGNLLSAENYVVFRQLNPGDTYRIIDLIAINNCEQAERHLAPSEYYTVQ